MPSTARVFVSSQSVQDKLTPLRVANTDRVTRTAVKAWASVQLREFERPDSPIRAKPHDWIASKLKEVVMPDACGSLLSDRSAHNLFVSLGEFVEHWHQSKGKRTTPAAVSNYLDGINRCPQEDEGIEVTILTDELFYQPGYGYRIAVDRITAQQQSEGVCTKPYNSLSDKEFEAIFNHECTSPSSPTGYIRKLMCVVGMFLGLRTTKMRDLNWSMFECELDHENKPCLSYRGVIGSYDGSCKGQKGNLQAAKLLPTTIKIFDETLSYDLNQYRIFTRHREHCRNTTNKKGDFFLSPIFRAAD